MKYITFQEGFIDDAKDTVSNAVGAVKNRVQTNIGNAANAVNGAVNSVREFGKGITQKATNVGNTIAKAANAVGAKGVLRPNKAPLISQQAAAIKNSLTTNASKAANVISRPVTGVINRAKQFIG